MSVERPPIVSVPSVELTGGRLRLRELRMDDAEAAMAWATDPEWFRHLPHEPVTTLAEERTFFSELLRDRDLRPRRQYHLAVEQADTHELVGMVRLGVSSRETYSADIGYGIRRDLWGAGLATEAAGLLVDFGFEQLGLHRIWAYHHPANPASGKVLERIGMVREGYLRHNMIAHGEWRDSVLWAVIEDDWRSGRG